MRKRLLAATLLSVAVLLFASPYAAQMMAQTIYPPSGGGGMVGLTCTVTSCVATVPVLGTSANFVGPLGLGNTTATPYIYLYSPSDGLLQQRNGVTVQTSEVYSTYTDASNYIKTVIGRSPYMADKQGITVEGLGTGANPSFVINTRGSGLLMLGSAGVTAVTITSAEGAYIQNLAIGGLTANGTMGRDSTGSLYRDVTTSFSWTNAQVAALAGTAGDITVATLPAKQQVIDAAVVITGQGVQAAGTFTVSCGDAIDGTPFDNLVLPSDAKAAVGTVYGDAVAERGTSLDTEWYYLPSYTATTLVTCHFITVGANLSTVTGSTGKVILVTRQLP